MKQNKAINKEMLYNCLLKQATTINDISFVQHKNDSFSNKICIGLKMKPCAANRAKLSKFWNKNKQFQNDVALALEKQNCLLANDSNIHVNNVFDFVRQRSSDDCNINITSSKDNFINDRNKSQKNIEIYDENCLTDIFNESVEIEKEFDNVSNVGNTKNIQNNYKSPNQKDVTAALEKPNCFTANDSNVHNVKNDFAYVPQRSSDDCINITSSKDYLINERNKPQKNIEIYDENCLTDIFNDSVEIEKELDHISNVGNSNVQKDNRSPNFNKQIKLRKRYPNDHGSYKINTLIGLTKEMIRIEILKIVDSAKITCVISFVSARRNSNDTFTCYAHCKYKNHNRNFRFFITNFNSDPLLNISSDGEDIQHQGHEFRQVRGIKRKEARSKLLLNNANIVHLESLNTVDKDLARKGNKQYLVKADVLHKINWESKCKNDLILDCDLADLSAFYDHETNKEKEKYIQRVSNPLEVHCYMDHIFTLCEKKKVVLYFDATGGLVRIPKCCKGTHDNSKIYYYAGVIKENDEIIPIMELISMQHDNTVIKDIIQKVLRAMELHSPKIINPFSVFVTDWSWATISGACQSLNKCAVDKYVDLSYKCVTEQKKNVDLVTCIVICDAHFLKAVSNQIRNKVGRSKTDLRNLVLDLFGLMLKADTLLDIDKIYESMVKVCFSKKKSKLFYEGMHNINECLTTSSNNKAACDDIDGDCWSNQILKEDAKVKSAQYLKSPFYTRFEKIKMSIKIEIIELSDIYDEEDLNIYYCPELIDHFTKLYMSYLPLWGTILTKVYGFNEPFSNTFVENWFNVEKNVYFRNERNMKVSRFLKGNKVVINLIYQKIINSDLFPKKKQRSRNINTKLKRLKKCSTANPSSHTSTPKSVMSVESDFGYLNPEDPKLVETWHKRSTPKVSHLNSSYIRNLRDKAQFHSKRNLSVIIERSLAEIHSKPEVSDKTLINNECLTAIPTLLDTETLTLARSTPKLTKSSTTNFFQNIIEESEVDGIASVDVSQLSVDCTSKPTVVKNIIDVKDSSEELINDDITIPNKTGNYPHKNALSNGLFNNPLYYSQIVSQNGVVVARYGKNKLYQGDYNSLDGCKWLTDYCVDACIQMIIKNKPNVEAMTVDEVSYIFNPKLRLPMRKRSTDLNLQNLTYAILPYTSGIHFVLIVFDLQNAEYIYLNSKDSLNPFSGNNLLLEGITNYFDRYDTLYHTNYSKQHWKLSDRFNELQDLQKNSFDCGVYLLMYIDLIVNGTPLIKRTTYRQNLKQKLLLHSDSMIDCCLDCGELRLVGKYQMVMCSVCRRFIDYRCIRVYDKRAFTKWCDEKTVLICRLCTKYNPT